MTTKAQSEAPSVDEIDKILYEYAMWRDNYYQDLAAGALTEKEWIDIRDKVQSEAKSKINRLIIDELEKLVSIPTDKRIGAIRARIQELKNE